MTESPSQYTETFYTSEAALARRFKANARRSAFKGETRAAALAWQKKARRRLGELIGLSRFDAVPPRPKRLESVQVDGLTRELWHIQTERDVWMPFYLFIPATTSAPAATSAPRPLVITPHGHGSGGKWATAGRRDIPAIAKTIEGHNYDYGVQLARAGFVTACPDARGFGERREPALQHDRQAPELLLNSSCHQLTLAGAPLGLTVQGMWTWDLMRLVDYLSTDQRIDADHIGCAGLSGGGLQTLLLSALDTRIKAAVVSGYFYGVREALQERNGNCMCNMVPGLWEEFDMGDIGALAAPRGFFVETGDADPLNGRSNLANVRPQVNITRKTFKALGAPENLKHHIFAGEHQWNGTQAIPWLQQQLGLNI